MAEGTGKLSIRLDQDFESRRASNHPPPTPVSIYWEDERVLEEVEVGENLLPQLYHLGSEVKVGGWA